MKLLWDILRLWSSRRTALGLCVNLTLWQARGANKPPYALLYIGALCHGRNLVSVSHIVLCNEVWRWQFVPWWTCFVTHCSQWAILIMCVAWTNLFSASLQLKGMSFLCQYTEAENLAALKGLSWEINWFVIDQWTCSFMYRASKIMLLRILSIGHYSTVSGKNKCKCTCL